MMEHFCKCGCGQPIIIRQHHKWMGIPEYLRGHSTRINNPMRGRKHSEETRNKYSQVRKGMPSHRKGKTGIYSNETLLRLSAALRVRWQNAEYRAVQHRIHTGKTISAEQREIVRHAATGRKKTAEERRKIGNARRGMRLSTETRAKIGAAHRGIPKTAMHREKVRQAKREAWRDPEFAKKMGRAWGTKPNRAEIYLITLLDILYPGEWKYTGDFSFTINGKCPDFVNCNGQKKIIELFGDYWHRGEDPKERPAVFEPFGYKTLILWEHELNNIDLLVEKISTFMVT